MVHRLEKDAGGALWPASSFQLKFRRFETMKRALVAALASLMLAGVLAGASEPVVDLGPLSAFSIVEGSAPVLVGAPLAAPYGDSVSH